MTLWQKKSRTRSTRQRRTVSDMTADELRAMIEALLDRKLTDLAFTSTRGKNQITASMRQRALSAAGRFHSGRSDVAIDHDQYLAESYSA